jgi:hypothetical protein
MDRSKVDNIATDLRADASNRDLALQHVTQLLTEISDQTEALSQFSSDYAVKLQQSISGVRHQNEQDMSTMQESMKLIEDSQARLAESLVLLSKQIEEHRQQSDSQAEADEWTQLLDQTETQTTSLSDMQATTSQSLNGAAQTLQGLAALDSGNGRLATTSNKLTGLSNTFDGFGKLGGLFGGFGAKKPNQSPSPQRQASRSPSRRLAARGPAPVFTTKSPPSQERVAMRKFAPPPQRIASVGHNTGSRSSNQEPPTVKPIVPQVKLMPPPPLPPRSISAPSTLAEERVENKPKLPPRSPQRPTVPRKSHTLSLSSPKLVSDTPIKSPSSILPHHHHGRSSSSPVVGIPPSTGPLSLAVGPAIATDSDRAHSSPTASPSSISSPGLGTSPSLIRSTGSSPRRPKAKEEEQEQEQEALPSGIEVHLESLSFAQKRERIQGSVFPTPACVKG